ncbi:MAG: hypothetical protein KDA61_11385, partial [Planctomycetales bacterium]|nr:hypothetical protein [Planctomycetales bacterium]
MSSTQMPPQADSSDRGPSHASTSNPTRESRPRDDANMSTLAVHAGEARQKPGDSITDPIFCASTYTFKSTQAVIDYIEQGQDREEYGRYG